MYNQSKKEIVRETTSEGLVSGLALLFENFRGGQGNFGKEVSSIVILLNHFILSLNIFLPFLFNFELSSIRYIS